MKSKGKIGARKEKEGLGVALGLGNLGIGKRKRHRILREIEEIETTRTKGPHLLVNFGFFFFFL